MITGVGIDVVDIARFDDIKAEFVQRVLSVDEYEEFRTFVLDKRKREFLSARIAVKEAYVKACGTGFRGISFTDLTVKKDSLGKPYLIVFNTVSDDIIHISISHSDTTAVAVVIIEQIKKE